MQHLLLDELLEAKLHSAKDAHQTLFKTIRSLIQQLEKFQSDINELDVDAPESKRDELFRNKREVTNRLDELRSLVQCSTAPVVLLCNTLSSLAHAALGALSYR